MPRVNEREAFGNAIFSRILALRTIAALDSSSSSSDTSSTSSSSDDDDIEPMLHALRFAYSRRYLNRRRRITRSASSMEICFDHYRIEVPDHFRMNARMEPRAFNLLCARLNDFLCNLSGRGPRQIPVEFQLLVALKRFGRYGNGASVHEIAQWSGFGAGTVQLITRRVVRAIHLSDLRREHIRWPTGAEKEEAKNWADQKARRAIGWREGFCFVDGTLIPLYARPYHYGDCFFDRRSRYSLNVQIINTPNLRIIDYSSGFVGSSHDARCFAYTKLARQHSQLLAPGEFCWADVAYPLSKWLMIPYKEPYCNTPENRAFNTQLSRIRIKSEHAIGYLKGRFQSLKELRILIQSEAEIKFAVAWINACLILHSFCIDEESSIKEDMLRNGVQWEYEQRQGRGRRGYEGPQESPYERRRRLRDGEAFRSILKGSLHA